MLKGFFEQGVGRGACSVRSTHRPGIAVPLGTVHSFLCLKTGFIPKQRSLFQEQRTAQLPPPRAPPHARNAAGKDALLLYYKNRIHSQEALPLPKAENFAPPPRSVSSLQSSWATSEFSLLYYIFKYINK